MRDRLIELIASIRYWDSCTSQEIADHLLANGVIVPPCSTHMVLAKVQMDCPVCGHTMYVEFEKGVDNENT